MLCALDDRDEREILAVVTHRKDNTDATAAAVNPIDTYPGRPDIPIGTDKAGPITRRKYAKLKREPAPDSYPPAGAKSLPMAF